MSDINISVPGLPFLNLASTDTIALLRARSSSGLTQGENIVVDGSAAVGDGLGNTYAWDALSTADDDGATTIKPTDRTSLQAGRWKAIIIIPTPAELSGFVRTDDLASTVPDNGAALVGFLQAGTGAVARTALIKMREIVSVKDFGAVGDGVTDDTGALQAARDYIASTGAALVFTTGIYKYTVSPNWAINDAQIIAEGEVRLRYTGVGDAVIINGGDTGLNQIYNMHMGRFIIEAPTTAQNGVLIQAAHHSEFGFAVHGAGATYAGIHVKFCVCALFNMPVVSENPTGTGWYLNARPLYGIRLSIRASQPETTSYCTFVNAICEGLGQDGILLDGALGNTFLGGTSEGNQQATGYGVRITANAQNNKFLGMDFEANTTADIYTIGPLGPIGDTFINCDTTNKITIGTGSNNIKIIGGVHSSITIEAGAVSTVVENVTIDRLDDGGEFIDAGDGSIVTNVRKLSDQSVWLTASDTWNPGTINAATIATHTIAIPDLIASDTVTGSFTNATAGLSLTVWTYGVANSAIMALTNITGGNIVVPDGGTAKIVGKRGPG